MSSADRVTAASHLKVLEDGTRLGGRKLAAGEDTGLHGGLITLSYPMFVCRCPVNEGEDSGVVTVRYVPRGRLVELASLRTFFESYAERAELHEVVVGEIAHILWDALKPEGLTVEIDFAPVEGIDCTVRRVMGDIDRRLRA